MVDVDGALRDRRRRDPLEVGGQERGVLLTPGGPAVDLLQLLTADGGVDARALGPADKRVLADALLDLIAQSYQGFPAGQLAVGDGHTTAVIGLVTRSFVLAMALASPFILGGLLYQMLTGVVNRVMPSLPVVFIGAPAIILLALGALAVLAPAILSGWAEAVFFHAR